MVLERKALKILLGGNHDVTVMEVGIGLFVGTKTEVEMDFFSPMFSVQAFERMQVCLCKSFNHRNTQVITEML